MQIHTKNKEFKKHLKESFKAIAKSEERKWSEYELRLLIQDELLATGEQK